MAEGISNVSAANPPRMASQGGNTTASTQAPYGIMVPEDTDVAPLVPQNYRHWYTPGVGGKGNGVGNSVPMNTI